MILKKCESVNTLEEKLCKINEINLQGFVCASCGSKEFNYHGSYERNLVVIENGQIIEKKVTIKRVRCKGCGITHAILPDFIMPYKIYDLQFILKVINDKYNNKLNYSEIESKYNVARQLVSYWMKLFLDLLSKILLLNLDNLLSFNEHEYYVNYHELFLINHHKCVYCYVST